MPIFPTLQSPQRRNIIGKSLLMGVLLGECAAFFFLFYSLESGSSTVSNRNKIIAGGLFALGIVGMLIYGLRNPRECGDGEEETRTPIVVTTANLFPVNNEQRGAGAATPLLSQQPQETHQAPGH